MGNADSRRGGRGAQRDELRLKHKTFRQAQPNRHLGWWAASATLVLLLVVGLVAALTLTPTKRDPLAQDRASAATAIKALDDGDLDAVDKQLAANRGNRDFAHFFASKATPRSLGDALASVAVGGKGIPFKAGVDTHAYELALTDLAGVVSLASHGTGSRALPASWTEDFISATTNPEVLNDKTTTTTTETEKARAHQDSANRQNLLLLLSRGYWSTEFLKSVTAAYWNFDHDKGDDAWTDDTLEDAKYAPAPNGAYLTDGVLALTAALTANPAASRWAFTNFYPGTEEIDGTDYSVGKVTHFLMFEHKFPETSDGKSIGMTATLTALSAAIDATGGGSEVQAATFTRATSNNVGPEHDSIVLRALAQDVKNGSGCSLKPLDYLNCAKAIAAAAEHWGHSLLDILSLATFAPPPFTAIGIAIGVPAAATNATWYAVEGDYATAGLSLATAVPGLAFTRIAKGVKAGAAAEKTAAESDDIAKAAKEIRAGSETGTARELAEAGALRIEKSPRPGYALESQARDDLAKEIPGATTETRLDPHCRTSCTGKRYADIFDSKSGTCIEVKKGIGSSNFKHEVNEVAKDRLLLRNKECKAVEYRFVPDTDGRVGPHQALRKLLQENGIPYAMYVP